MIERIEAHHQGVSVNLRLAPGALRLQDSGGAKDLIEVRHLRATMYPDAKTTPRVHGRGLQVLKSGHVGTRDRNVYAGWSQLPEEVQAAITDAADKALRFVSPEDAERIEKAVSAAERAAEGDSNDREIQALQEALDECLSVLHIRTEV